MKSRIEVMQGDITTVAADAIVNAANTSLLGGGWRGWRYSTGITRSTGNC